MGTVITEIGDTIIHLLNNIRNREEVRINNMFSSSMYDMIINKFSVEITDKVGSNYGVEIFKELSNYTNFNFRG